MTYADERDDAEAGRADMAALLTPDPREWTPYDWNPMANRCPTHGGYMPAATTHYRCPRCWTDTDLTTHPTPPGAP